MTYGYGCALAPCLVPVAYDMGVAEAGVGDWLSTISNSSRETTCNAGREGGTCNTYTGECECSLGFAGIECESRECPWTPDPLTLDPETGEMEDKLCSGHGVCNYTTGICQCDAAYGDTVGCSRLLCWDSVVQSYGLTCFNNTHPNSYCDHGTYVDPTAGIRPAFNDGTCKCEQVMRA